MKETLRGPGGLIIELDSDQIFPDDPGQGTPAMVIQRKEGRDAYCATYNCAASEHTLEGDHGDFLILNDTKSNWLDAQVDRISQWLTEHAPSKQPAQH